jgi:hypothetical protein
MASNHHVAAAVLALLAGVAAQTPPDPQAGAAIQTPRLDKDKLAEKLRALGASDTTLTQLRKDFENPFDSKASDRALRTVVPGYAAAMQKVDQSDPGSALALSQLLAANKDPLVAAHGRYWLGRVLLDGDDPEGAANVLIEFVRDSRGLTTLDADAVFHFCYALAQIPAPEDAILNFKAFLQLYDKESPERHLATAKQILAELEAQYQSPLHGLADNMKGVERKIRKTDTGEKTQTRQKDIVTKLDQLIEEIEKRENQGGGGAPNGNQQPNGPANQSALSPGPTRIGSLHGTGNLKDRWGMMKDEERKKILADVQRGLPDRYRDLLEQYYKKLNQGGR